MTAPGTRTDVVIRTYGPGQVPPMLDVLADIWADAHPELVDNPAAETAGLSVPALHRQVTGHLKKPGFTLIAAYAAGTAVGFGYAFPCTGDYWFGPGLVDQVPEGARTERLMGLCELAVRPPWPVPGHRIVPARRAADRHQPAVVVAAHPALQPSRPGPVRPPRLPLRRPLPQH